jgi:hypothetical protein
VLKHRTGQDGEGRARVRACELPHRLFQRIQGGLADRGGLQRPSQQPRLGLGSQLQAGRFVAEQLGSGPDERPGQQVAVEVAGLLVVVNPAAGQGD